MCSLFLFFFYMCHLPCHSYLYTYIFYELSQKICFNTFPLSHSFLLNSSFLRRSTNKNLPHHLIFTCKSLLLNFFSLFLYIYVFFSICVNTPNSLDLSLSVYMYIFLYLFKLFFLCMRISYNYFTYSFVVVI